MRALSSLQVVETSVLRHVNHNQEAHASGPEVGCRNDALGDEKSANSVPKLLFVIYFPTLAQDGLSHANSI